MLRQDLVAQVLKRGYVQAGIRTIGESLFHFYLRMTDEVVSRGYGFEIYGLDTPKMVSWIPDHAQMTQEEALGWLTQNLAGRIMFYEKLKRGDVEIVDFYLKKKQQKALESLRDQ